MGEWMALVMAAVVTATAFGADERQFGLHFDFHAAPAKDGKSVVIGGTLKESDIREICRTIRPDFLQIDCKGHPGWASYPTKLGNAMPDIKGDPLRIWRRVTKEEGVALFLHYSGVYDMKYAAAHPDDRVILADGEACDSVVLDGRYADALLIPQLKELAGEYGAEGAWVDGECWAAAPDFTPRSLAAFERATGVCLDGGMPSAPDKPHYEQYRAHARELFRRYLNHYVDAGHADFPRFKICSNWAFTDHMPEKVCANVDFLSGDVDQRDSFWSARYAARGVALQGRPWDLMAWGFRILADGGEFVSKSVPQLMQEASAVIALGGGFQVYIPQARDGSPQMDRIRPLKPLADFVRRRQPYCFGGTPVRQVAVLLSTYDCNRESRGLYSRTGCDKVSGLVNLLCDAGHSVSIVMEHHLDASTVASWPVIVVPELFEGLAPETVSLLRGYAREGGNLVVSGVKSRKLLAGECGDAMDRIVSFGKGRLAVFGEDIGKAYFAAMRSEHRDRARRILRALYRPLAEVESAHGSLEVVDLVKDGRLMVQLVNGNGNHHAANVITEDFVPPVTDVRLRIRTAAKPRALRLQPDGRDLPFEWRDGIATVEIPKVEMHAVVEVCTRMPQIML